jgi:hypothetical protein
MRTLGVSVQNTPNAAIRWSAAGVVGSSIRIRTCRQVGSDTSDLQPDIKQEAIQKLTADARRTPIETSSMYVIRFARVETLLAHH